MCAGTGRNFYRRRDRDTAGLPVYKGLYMGQHFCWGSFLLQWIFLRLWKILYRFYTQYGLYPTCEDSGILSGIGMFRCDFVPHGTGGTGRICSFYRDLPHCFLVDETERHGRKWQGGCIKKCKHR